MQKECKQADKKSLGLYIHIPFCRQKCLYCDFCSIPKPSDDSVQAYIDSLLKNIDCYALDAKGYEVDTVYVGGGTPTVIPAEKLSQIIEMCYEKYSFAENVEISCECNPATASREYFKDMRVNYNRNALLILSISVVV